MVSRREKPLTARLADLDSVVKRINQFVCLKVRPVTPFARFLPTAFSTPIISSDHAPRAGLP